MTLGELVTHARQRAYSLLKKRLEQRKSEGLKTFAEPALRNKFGEIVYAPDGLKLPLRYDLAFEDSTGKVQTENTDSSTVNFREPILAQWENCLKVEIRSISWDYMRFQISPVNTQTNWEPIRQWFLRWFDAEDEKAPNEDGLIGIAHFISDPEVAAGTAEIVVDLGSAPSDALGAFFDGLIQIGAQNCIIGEACDSAEFSVKA